MTKKRDRYVLKKRDMVVIVLSVALLSFIVMDDITGRTVYGETFSKGTMAIDLNYLAGMPFLMDGHRYVVVITLVKNDSIKLRVSPIFLDFEVKEGETEILDINDNDIGDFSVGLEKINSNKLGGTFIFSFLDEG